MTHKEKFIELLGKTKGVNHSQVFNDFLKIAATSLANANSCDEVVRQEREEIFQKTIGCYDADTQKMFVDMFSELGLELKDCVSVNNYHDVLGEIFQKFNMDERKNGQVFTPKHIGNLMGELAFDKETLHSEIQKNGYVTIIEPCCGSGTITLGALNTLSMLGINPSTQCRVIAYDLDERCVLMTYIQLSLYGIPAVVIQKDAISGESCGSAWQTI